MRVCLLGDGFDKSTKVVSQVVARDERGVVVVLGAENGAQE
jgi:hypothetical protein